MYCSLALLALFAQPDHGVVVGSYAGVLLQFPQIPHYHLEEATEAAKKVMGPYYREPKKSPGPLPAHLWEPLVRSFNNDHYVADTGDIVYYQRDARV